LLGSGAAEERFRLPEELTLSRGQVTIVDRATGHSYHLNDVEVRLRHEAAGYRLSGAFRAPRLVDGPVRMVVETPQAVTSLDAFNGRLYLQLPDTDADRIASLVPSSWGIDALRGRVRGEIWADVAGGLPQRITTDVHGEALTVPADVPLRLDSLSARADWRRQADGWKLDVGNLAFRRRGEPASPPAALSLQRDAGSYRGAVTTARVSDLVSLGKAAGVFPPETVEALDGAAPRGRLAGVRFAMAAGGNGPWRVAGSVDGVSARAHGHLPELNGFRADFVATDRGGSATVVGRNGDVFLPRLFRSKLPFQRLSADVRWWRGAGGGYEVAFPDIRVVNEDGRVNGRGRIWATPGQKPFLDLRAHLVDGSGEHTSRYLPVGVMPDDLVEWLDQGVRGGRVPQGDLILYGPADDFPFQHGEGVFDIQGDVVGGTLSYAPDWPIMEDLAGSLHFHNEGMVITATDGRSEGGRLRRATARIPNLKDAVLTVDGEFEGPGDDMLGFLRDSPLMEKKPDALDGVSLKGTPRLGLELRIPFEKGKPGIGKPVVDGSVTFGGATLSSQRGGLHVDDLKGVVRFNNDGFRWSGLQGRVDGHALVSGAHTRGTGTDARIQISALFNAPPGDLPHVPPVVRRIASGDADWYLAVNVPGFQAPGGNAGVELSSDLRGVRIAAPAPFGKPADRAGRFVVRTEVGPDELGSLSMTYGRDNRATVVLDGSDSPARVGVALGGAAVELPAERGVRVRGSIARLDLPAWRRFADGLVNADAAPEREAGSELPLNRADLQVGELVLGSVAVKSVDLGVRPWADGWAVNASGKAAQGRVRLDFRGEGHVNARLQRLHLVGAQSAGVGTDADADGVGPGVPPLKVSIDDLQVDGRSYGSLAAEITAAPGGGRKLESIRLSGSTYTAEASGAWKPGAGSGTSNVRFTMDAADTGKALASLGYAKTIEGGKGHAAGDLTWKGGLSSPDVATLAGKVRFNVTDGNLPEVEPGAGRVLGLLSLAQIPRRLLLDFSDLSGDGLAFDRIQASLTVEKGIARPDVFFIDSSVARIEASGAIDLKSRTYDQIVPVIPRLSSTFPLIGGLAGGPTAAIMLLMAQKLFQQGVDRLTQYRYRVTGPWENPTIEPVRRADARPEQRRVFNGR
jgi:uncharacterized protein (TIGR02099 family)